MEKKDLHHHTWKTIFFFLNVFSRSLQPAKAFPFSIICPLQFKHTLGSTLKGDTKNLQKRNSNLNYSIFSTMNLTEENKK